MEIKVKVKPKNGMIKIPCIKSSHCNMQQFRESKKFGSVCNSDLFEPMLNRHLAKSGIPVQRPIKLDDLPDNVSIKEGYLLTVIIELGDL